MSKDLWEITEQLANGKDADGTELSEGERTQLRNQSTHLQLTLLALGMTSQEIQGLVEEASDVSE